MWFVDSGPLLYFAPYCCDLTENIKWENIFKNSFVDTGKKAKLSRASPGSYLVSGYMNNKLPNLTVKANRFGTHMGNPGHFGPPKPDDS